jgi:hypothetical protein
MGRATQPEGRPARKASTARGDQSADRTPAHFVSISAMAAEKPASERRLCYIAWRAGSRGERLTGRKRRTATLAPRRRAERRQRMRAGFMG